MRSLAFLLLLTGCAPSAYLENPQITNHVDDWRDEVVYQVLVDRFANGDVNNDFNVSLDPNDLARYQGGDYEGLIAEADYLSQLGITAIWISPVVANVEEDAGVAGYHGYWTQDFTSVNPHFGDIAKLRQLVEVMHDRDIKVIVDIVVNHVGQLFYYDINRNGQADITTYYGTDGSDSLDVVTEWDPKFDPRRIQGWTSLGESGEAPVEWVHMPEINRVGPNPPEFKNPDWYNRMGRVTDWNDNEQVMYGDFPGGLKDLATENPNVRRALIEIFSDWITKTNIDGYRIDTVKHVEHSFWEEFSPAIREHAAAIGKDKFLMFGESFDGNDQLIGSYTAPGMLDSVANFSGKYRVFDGVFKNGAPTSEVVALHEERQLNWGLEPQEGGIEVSAAEMPVNFLDNHDVPRFQFEQENDQALKTALAFLLTGQGLPVIYYGTEQGFSGGNDPANREDLWLSGYRTNGEIFQWTATLNEIRAEWPALRRGDMQFVQTTDDGAGILAFQRTFNQESVVVAINTHDTEARTVDVPSAFVSGVLVEDLLGGLAVTAGPDGQLVFELQPRQSAILVE